MPSTTLKLPPVLKKQVASIVRGTDKSAHTFMLEAIAKHADAAMRRKAFVAGALSAERQMVRTGLAFDFDDVRKYFKARIAGKPARAPRLKRWRNAKAVLKGLGLTGYKGKAIAIEDMNPLAALKVQRSSGTRVALAE